MIATNKGKLLGDFCTHSEYSNFRWHYRVCYLCCSLNQICMIYASCLVDEHLGRLFSDVYFFWFPLIKFVCNIIIISVIDLTNTAIGNITCRLTCLTWHCNPKFYRNWGRFGYLPLKKEVIWGNQHLNWLVHVRS